MYVCRYDTTLDNYPFKLVMLITAFTRMYRKTTEKLRALVMSVVLRRVRNSRTIINVDLTTGAATQLPFQIVLLVALKGVIMH